MAHRLHRNSPSNHQPQSRWRPERIREQERRKARKQMELEPGEANEPVKRKGKSEPAAAAEPAPDKSAKVKKPRGKSST